MEKIVSAFRTSLKQVRRSGWLAWASTAVMALAVLVSTIFGFLAYTAELFLTSVEREPQIYVVLEIGTPESEINSLKNKVEEFNGVEYAEYTSEDKAREDFARSQRQVNELAARAVEERQLPATLAVRLTRLDFANTVNDELDKAKAENPAIKQIIFTREIAENIREVFSWLRLGGGLIIGMLLIVIVLFTLLTVEFRMHSRAEEIEIMQLVGGSLGYIRLPFIIEGAIYGFLGALFSNLIVGGIAIFIFQQWSSGKLNFSKGFVSNLDWPTITVSRLALGFAVVLALGIAVGVINSYVAIRRYIK